MRRRLKIESLESRCLMASLPFGAAPEDTGEFMLGRIAVTPVFVESSGALDPSTEDWTTAQKQEVLQKIETGLDWWRQLLATKTSKHTLEFVVDRTFADNPFVSQYEPINRRSNDYSLFVDEFLVDRGFSQSPLLETNMRAFNHAQRLKLQTDWSFTIFVVNSQNDGEGTFAPGGSFSRAFSFAGGLFQIVPSTRPASTFTHETGHMFWARDEYIGGSNYYQKRGYYNAQNTNAIDLNPNPNFVQEDTIMSEGSALDRAYTQIVSSPATLAQIGWVDSDNDGIFDILDVPLSLEGVGRFDPLNREYIFRGDARVQTLPNQNSAGPQNDITLNQVGRIEYKINDGPWTLLSTPESYTVDLNVKIAIPSGIQGTISIRAIDPRIGIVSNTFVGSLTPTLSSTHVDGVFGFAWNDQDQDGAWDSLETGVAGATVRLESPNGTLARNQTVLRPSDLPLGPLSGSVSGATLTAIGMDADGRVGVFEDSTTTLDTRAFRPYSWQQQLYRDSFRGTDTQLKVMFASPTSYVFVHILGADESSVGRVDAYDSSGKIIGRAESQSLSSGQSMGLEVETPTASIAYVIAYGHDGTAIKIDQIRFGLPGIVTTDQDGFYAFPGMTSGNFVVKVTPPSASFGTTVPANGVSTITVPNSGDLRSDFGLLLTVSPWQNQSRRQDVNNDGQIDLFDVLVVINEINRNGARELAETDKAPPPFIDVDGNRIVEALDVLIVINYINSQLTPPSGEGESSQAWGLVSMDSMIDIDPLSQRRRRG